jgi:hypothetical protein
VQGQILSPASGLVEGRAGRAAQLSPVSRFKKVWSEERRALILEEREEEDFEENLQNSFVDFQLDIQDLDIEDQSGTKGEAGV